MTRESDPLDPLFIALVGAALLGSWAVDMTAGVFATYRFVVGFLAVTVLPGYLLLGLAGIERRSLSRLLLYAVGVSLPYTIALCLLGGALVAALGVASPLAAVVPLVACSLLGLSAVAVLGLRPFPRSPLRDLSPSVRDFRAVLVLSCLPALAVATTGNRVGVVALLGLVSLVPLALATGVLPRRTAPYAVWTVAATVLLHATLVSGHLWGWDIHYEYYSASCIAAAGGWQPGLRTASNSLLTVTYLASVYAAATGLELVWVYKLCYPLVVAALPVGIYHVGRLAFDVRPVAVLSPFVFVFYYGFWKDMPDKQAVASLYVLLVVLVSLDDLPEGQRRALAVAFVATLVVSHYGISLLFVLFLCATLLLTVAGGLVGAPAEHRLAPPGFIALTGVFWVGWYLFSAGGLNFDRVAVLGYATVLDVGLLALSLASGGGDLLAVFGETTTRSGADYVTRSYDSLVWRVYHALYIALVAAAGWGLLSSLRDVLAGVDTGRDELTLFAAVVFAFLGSSVVFTFGMGFDRALHIALVVLSPFVIAGLYRIADRLAGRLRTRPSDGPLSRPAVFCALFLLVFFPFSSGAAFAAADEPVPPYAIPLDSEAGWPVYSDSEVHASRWAADAASADGSNVALYNRWSHLKSRDALLVSEVLPGHRLVGAWENRTNLDGEGVGFLYVSDRPMTVAGSDSAYIDGRETRFHDQVVARADRIYTSGDAAVYRFRPAAERAPSGRDESVHVSPHLGNEDERQQGVAERAENRETDRRRNR